jgi:hypothetical protein
VRSSSAPSRSRSSAPRPPRSSATSRSSNTSTRGARPGPDRQRAAHPNPNFPHLRPGHHRETPCPPSPAPGKFTGVTDFGPHRLIQVDGVAQYDGDLPDGLALYFAANGYGVDGPAAEPAADPELVDPRDVETVVINSQRDAAVDPQPEDFLPPVNAGTDNPHGPRVVAPGIHAANMPKPIHPGPVGASGDTTTEDTPDDPNVVKDTDTQADNESALAEAVLVEHTPVPEATADAAKVDPVNTDAYTDDTFDPARHTVAEVNDYLAGAPDDERARVLDAERAGKNRATVAGNTGE